MALSHTPYARPEAVVFDIGNVLIRWQPEELYDQWVGPERRKELFAAIDLHAMNDRIDRGEAFQQVVYEFADQHPTYHTEIRWWHDRWLDMAQPAIDQSVKTLHALKRRGVPVFALSNFGRETFELAEDKFDFLSDFDRRYISGHMQVTKPAPRIYEMLEADCGISPSALLFVDDREENITAAMQRGWQTHQFLDPHHWANHLISIGLIDEGDL